MTPEFDKLYSEIIEEAAAKCTRETGTQLSDHPDFRFSRCTRNPYSDGFRRVRFCRNDGSFDYQARCQKPQRKGTEGYFACQWFHKALRRRKILARIQLLRKKKIP